MNVQCSFGLRMGPTKWPCPGFDHREHHRKSVKVSLFDGRNARAHEHKQGQQTEGAGYRDFPLGKDCLPASSDRDHQSTWLTIYQLLKEARNILVAYR